VIVLIPLVCLDGFSYHRMVNENTSGNFVYGKEPLPNSDAFAFPKVGIKSQNRSMFLGRQPS